MKLRHPEKVNNPINPIKKKPHWIKSKIVNTQNYFKTKVTEPIKLHVSAKRYLCREKSYYNLLSNASKVSLELQGGKMNDDEAQKFILLKHYKEAITLRQYDERGKIPNMKIKSINDYKELIVNHLLNQQT